MRDWGRRQWISAGLIAFGILANIAVGVADQLLPFSGWTYFVLTTAAFLVMMAGLLLWPRLPNDSGTREEVSVRFPWLPPFVAFFVCAFISIPQLFMGSTAMPAFYSFLPMCFFFLGGELYALKKEVISLRQRLDEIEKAG